MRRVLIVVSAAVLVDTIFVTALAPLLPELVDEVGLSKSEAGVLTAAFAAGAAVAAIPSGLIVSRIGVKAMVLVGLGITALGTVGFAFAEGMWALNVMRFVQGIGSAFAWTGGLAWVISVSPRERWGEIIGVAIGAAFGGALIGPVLGGAAALTSLEVTFGPFAIVNVVLGWFVWRTVSPPRPKRSPFSGILIVVRSSGIRLGIWLILLTGMLVGALSVLAPLELSRLGFGAVAIAAVFLIGAALEIGGAPFIGRWTDRRGRLEAVWLALGLSIAVTLALPWMDDAFGLAAVVAVAGLVFSIHLVPGVAIVTDASEAVGIELGFGFALINLAWAPGDVVGAAAGGALADVSSDALPYGLLAAACLATGVVLWRTRLRRPELMKAATVRADP